MIDYWATIIFMIAIVVLGIVGVHVVGALFHRLFEWVERKKDD